MFSVRRDEKMAIGRVRVEARRRTASHAGGRWKIGREEFSHALDVFFVDVAANHVRIGFLAFVMNGCLHAVTTIGNEIEESIGGVLDHRDRTRGRREELRVARGREPVHHLPFDSEPNRVVPEQGRCPRSSAKSQASRVVLAL